MKILLIGPGAVGGLYGAKIAQVGAEVSVVCRSDYQETKDRGISIKSLWGDFVFRPHQVLCEVADYKDRADLILIATKVLPEIDLPSLISPVVASETSVAIIQNGIFIENDLAKAYPNNHFLSIIAFVATRKEKAAEIEHDGDGRLTIGEYQNPNSTKTKLLMDLWLKSGVPCALSNDIQFDRWKKLLWNASFNPISVIAGGLDTKQILDDAKLNNLVRSVMLEVKTLAAAQGYELSEELIDQTIKATADRKVPAITSMLLDFRAKRQMEIEAILGNALKFGIQNQVQTPLIKEFYQKLNELQK